MVLLDFQNLFRQVLTNTRLPLIFSTVYGLRKMEWKVFGIRWKVVCVMIYWEWWGTCSLCISGKTREVRSDKKYVMTIKGYDGDYKNISGCLNRHFEWITRRHQGVEWLNICSSVLMWHSWKVNLVLCEDQGGGKKTMLKMLKSKESHLLCQLMGAQIEW